MRLPCVQGAGSVDHLSCLCLCSEIGSLRKVISESTPAESSLSQVIASLEQRSLDLSCDTTGGGGAGNGTHDRLSVCL